MFCHPSTLFIIKELQCFRFDCKLLFFFFIRCIHYPEIFVHIPKVTGYQCFELGFDEKFVVDDDMLATLKEIGEKEGVKFNEEQYQKSLPLIKTQLKALIARDLWDMNEYFRIMNTTNESIQKALEILNSDEYQKKLK